MCEEASKLRLTYFGIRELEIWSVLHKLRIACCLFELSIGLAGVVLKFALRKICYWLRKIKGALSIEFASHVNIYHRQETCSSRK